MREELKERRCEECFHYGACRRLIDGENEVLIPCELFLKKDQEQVFYCLGSPCETCKWYDTPISDEMLEACRNCELAEIKVFDVKELSAYYEIEVYETKEEAEEAKRKRERRTKDQACDGAGDA